MLARRVRTERTAAALSLVAAVAAGCAWMTANGAPPRYAALNAGALAIGLGLALGLNKLPPRIAIWLALLAAPMLAGWALAIGPEVGGVRRWIELGGLTVHAVMLAGPMFAVAASRAGDHPLAALAGIAFALLLAVQPDFATALALLCALGSVMLIKPGKATVAAMLGAAAAAIFTSRGPAAPAPVEFVEGVIQRAAVDAGALSLAMLAALGLAVMAPAFTLPARRGGWALAAWMAGLVGASLLGPYPVPLIGYGAAAIVGYALALGLPDRGNA